MRTLADSAVRDALLARLARLRPQGRALWGRMTPHEMVCHLCDSFRVGLGEKRASMAAGLAQRTLLKWGALWIPIPWPNGVPTRPEIEQGLGGTVPLEFERDRAELASLIGRFSARGEGFGAHPHPTFGELRDAEWLRWGYLHTDHHLRQFGV